MNFPDDDEQNEYPSERDLDEDGEDIEVDETDSDPDAEENPRRNKKGQFVKGGGKRKRKAKRGATKRKKSTAKRGARKKGTTKAKGLAGRVGKLEGAVRALTNNDKQTQKYLTGVVNAVRRSNGVKPLPKLPGYRVVPGYKSTVGRKSGLRT